MSSRHLSVVPAVSFTNLSNPVLAPMVMPDERAKRLAERVLEDDCQKKSRGEITLQGRATSTLEASELAENTSTPISDNELREICFKLRSLIRAGNLNDLKIFCQQICEIPEADLNRFNHLWHPINWVVEELKMSQLNPEVFRLLFAVGFKASQRSLFTLWERIEKEADEIATTEMFSEMLWGPATKNVEIFLDNQTLTSLFLKHMKKEELKLVIQSLCRKLHEAAQRPYEQDKILKHFSYLAPCLQEDDAEAYRQNLCEIISELSQSEIELLQRCSIAKNLLLAFNANFGSKIQQQLSLDQLRSCAGRFRQIAALDWNYACDLGHEHLRRFLASRVETTILGMLLMCPLNIDATHFNLAMKYCSQEVVVLLIEAWCRQKVCQVLFKQFPDLQVIRFWDKRVLRLGEKPVGASTNFSTPELYAQSLLGWRQQAQPLLSDTSQPMTFGQCQRLFIELLNFFLTHFNGEEIDLFKSKFYSCDSSAMRAIISEVSKFLSQAWFKLTICELGRTSSLPALGQEHVRKFQQRVDAIKIEWEHLNVGLFANLPPELFRLMLQRADTKNRMSYIENACKAQCSVSLLQLLYWNRDLAHFSTQTPAHFYPEDVWNEDCLIDRHLKIAVESEAPKEVVQFLLYRMKSQYAKDPNTHQRYLSETFTAGLKTRASVQVLQLVLCDYNQAHGNQSNQLSRLDSFFSLRLNECINHYAPVELIEYLIGIGNGRIPEIEHLRTVLRVYRQKKEDYDRVVWSEQTLRDVMNLLLKYPLKPSADDVRSASSSDVPHEILLQLIQKGEVNNEHLSLVLRLMIASEEKSSDRKWSAQEYHQVIQALVGRGVRPDFYCISNFVEGIRTYGCLFYQENQKICLKILKRLVKITPLKPEQIQRLTHSFSCERNVPEEIYQALAGEQGYS